VNLDGQLSNSLEKLTVSAHLVANLPFGVHDGCVIAIELVPDLGQRCVGEFPA